MHYKYTVSLLIIFLFFLFTGCDDNNSEIPVPVYLEIQDFTLQHEDNAIGITDVWVNVDGNLIGVYELPAKFPVIAEKPSTISLRAGIKVNGVGATRSYYPYYKTYEKTINFKPSEVIKINPQTTYEPWANIKLAEGFESGHRFEKDSKSDTVFVIAENEGFKGLYSGAVYLDTANRYFESCTPELSRPKLGTSGIFIELNYKCDIPFDIGIYIWYQQQWIPQNIVVVKDTEEWEKIYIDLYNPLLKYPEGTVYKIYISADHYMSELSSSVFIDDFKVVQSGDK